MRHRYNSTRVYSNEQLDASLKVGIVGHWMGGSGSGKGWLDRSGYGNHGTFIGSPKWNLGGPQSNRAAVKTAAGTDQVRCGVAPAATDVLTLSVAAWIVTFDTTNEQQIICKLKDDASGGWVFVIDAGGALTWFSSATAGTANVLSTNQILVTGRWYHVGYTQTDQLGASTNSVIYINGVPQSLASASSPTGSYPTDAAAQLSLAGRNFDTAGLIGIIDDARVYNRTISRAEMARLADPSFQPVIPVSRRVIPVIATNTLTVLIGEPMVGSHVF